MSIVDNRDIVWDEPADYADQILWSVEDPEELQLAVTEVADKTIANLTTTYDQLEVDISFDEFKERVAELTYNL